MSTSIIESWSDINGIVQSCNPSSDDMNGFIEVRVAVEKVSSVDSFANLLGHAQGGLLLVLIPEELVRSLGIESAVGIECRVHQAGLHRAFVQRDRIIVHDPNSE